jgi:hypothetical protein
MLSEYKMSAHLTKKGFMSNYLVWHQHWEVQPPVANELDRNDDDDRMDDMVADNGRGYDLGPAYPLPELHNFYRISPRHWRRWPEVQNFYRISSKR